MTEKEAIELLQENMSEIYFVGKHYDAMKMAISALKEIQQYRGAMEQVGQLKEYEAIGTVKECREAREKQKAKKPITYQSTNQADCPVCGAAVRGINNPFRNIPIKTPMLERILKSVMDTYISMTADETKVLDEEIKSVTETNCGAGIYDIAKMLEDRVDIYCKRYRSSCGGKVKRLTTNKDISEMGIVELAHNSSYRGEKGWARYRDYCLDIDARELARKLLKDFAGEDDIFTCDEDFDDYMAECLVDGTDSIEGLIALFYRNLWAMADLHAHLKYFEDLQ